MRRVSIRSPGLSAGWSGCRPPTGRAEMIIIVPYQPTWREEFLGIGGTLREALRELALRIDHIGSTSVPGLAAKDFIDIQITVQNLDPAVERALNRVGYARIERITQDHSPPGISSQVSEWMKWLFR